MKPGLSEKHGDDRPLMPHGGHLVYRRGPVELPVWECYDHTAHRGIVGHMRLVIELPANVETVRHRDNDGRNPRRAGTITVDGYQWNLQHKEVEEVEFEGRWYSPFLGLELIKDGAPFAVDQKAQKYEWCYRGWPPPGDVRRLAALEQHREGTQFQPLDPDSPTVLLQVRVPQALLDRLDADAAAEGVTRSELVRRRLEAPTR